MLSHCCVLEIRGSCSTCRSTSCVLTVTDRRPSSNIRRANSRAFTLQLNGAFTSGIVGGFYGCFLECLFGEPWLSFIVCPCCSLRGQSTLQVECEESRVSEPNDVDSGDPSGIVKMVSLPSLFSCSARGSRWPEKLPR